MSPPKQRRPAARRPPAYGHSPRLSVLAVCGFLLAAVAIVFGQTVGHDFVDFDDSKYVYENPQVCERTDGRGNRLGLHQQPRRATGIRSPGFPTCSTASSTGGTRRATI